MEKDPRVPWGGCRVCGGDPDDNHHHDLIRTTLELKRAREQIDDLNSEIRSFAKWVGEQNES